MRAVLIGTALLVFFLKPNGFVGQHVLALSEAPSQQCHQTQLRPFKLKGSGRQTENAQKEIRALQHYRCQSKVLALHVIKPAASMP